MFSVDCGSRDRAVVIRPHSIVELKVCEERIVEITARRAGRAVRHLRLAGGAEHPTRGVFFGYELALNSDEGRYLVPKSAFMPSEFVKFSSPGCRDAIVPVDELARKHLGPYVLELRPAESRTVSLSDICPSSRLYLCEEGPFRFVRSLEWTAEPQEYQWTGGAVSILGFPSESAPRLASLSAEQAADQETWKPIVECQGVVRVEGAPRGFGLLGIVSTGALVSPRIGQDGSQRFDGLPPGACLIGPDEIIRILGDDDRGPGDPSLVVSDAILKAEVVSGQLSTLAAPESWHDQHVYEGRIISTGARPENLVILPDYEGLPAAVRNTRSYFPVHYSGDFRVEAAGCAVTSFDVVEVGNLGGPVLGSFDPGAQPDGQGVLVRSGRASISIEDCDIDKALVIASSSQNPDIHVSRHGVPTGVWHDLGFFPIQVDTWTLRWAGRERRVYQQVTDGQGVNRIRISCDEE